MSHQIILLWQSINHNKEFRSNSFSKFWIKSSFSNTTQHCTYVEASENLFLFDLVDTGSVQLTNCLLKSRNEYVGPVKLSFVLSNLKLTFVWICTMTWKYVRGTIHKNCVLRQYFFSKISSISSTYLRSVTWPWQFSRYFFL